MRPSRDDGGALVAQPADEEQVLSSGEVLIDGDVLTGHAGHAQAAEPQARQ